MKSKYFKIVIASLALLTLMYVACKKAVLNILPPTTTELSYFTSESEFRTAILGVYASLTDFYSEDSSSGGQGDAMLQSFYLPGDDLTTTSTNPFELFGGGINSSNGDITHFFESNYILIGRANKVLEKVAAAPAGVFTTPGFKNNIQGEALFLRGFSEFQLWNAFGTAPIVTTIATSLKDIDKPSSTGTQLLDQAITDIGQASTLLPASWDATNTGRITANGAYGMLGKVLVFRASANKSIADYTAAIAAFNKITSSVSLVPNFEDNFNDTTENNAESLFEYQAGPNIHGPNNTNAWLANDACDCGVAGAYYQMFYATGNGSYMGGGLYIPTTKLIGAFDANDPRLPYTMTSDNSLITKYVLNNKVDGADGTTSYNNYRILRYADVLLLKAEATLQSGGSTGEAIGYINQVRTRARNMVAGGTIPANFDASTTDKATIMQWIMDERFRELAAEGQRWWDLRRWHIGGTITLTNAFFSSTNPAGMLFDPHFLYYPIPQAETNVNPDIKQNPGY